MFRPDLWEASGEKLRRVANLAVNVKDGSVMVRVPAGEFEMGDGREGDCPKHRVYVGEYWIGVYCVTNRQYGRFVKETGHRAPDNDRWKKEGLLDHPVTDVSWDDAVAYGKWAGLELPSEAQWEKACRGPLGLIYPWGNEWDKGKCRNGENKGSEETAEVWGYPVGVSGSGTYQQSGNVWECCADWYEREYYKRSAARDPRGPEWGSLRVRRGGGWGYGVASDFRGAGRESFDPHFRYDYQGFRLVGTVQ
jgi:formylglycine-generating enzyme